jgi:Ca2+-binding EF-hand superfamily protein
MDEVFYWLVNQMVGLQYNYRTQINKHLRKAFKLVDKKGKGEITVTEFFLLMQFIGY